MNPFSPSEILLVQTSFRKINRNGDRAAELFYTRLFQFDPALRGTNTELAEKKREFIRLLGTVVHRLDCLELVRDHLAELAFRHPDINNSDEHHHSIGAALFWMLEQVLEEEFTAVTYAAWMTVFRTLSDELKAAAREGTFVG